MHPLICSHLCFPHPCTHFVFAPLKSYHVSFLYGSLCGPPGIHHEAQIVTQATTTCLSLTACLIVQSELPVLQECQAPAVIHRANFKSSFKVLPVRFLFWSSCLGLSSVVILSLWRCLCYILASLLITQHPGLLCMPRKLQLLWSLSDLELVRVLPQEESPQELKSSYSRACSYMQG